MIERIPADGWELQRGHVERYEYAARYLTKADFVNDVACGVGYGAPILRQECFDYTGYDRYAVVDTRFQGERTHFVWCDIADPAWRPLPADVTVCFETLEHVPDPERLAAVISDTTDRLIFVSVPTVPTIRANPWHLHDFTVHDVPPLFPGWRVEECWEQPAELCHVWRFERERE